MGTLRTPKMQEIYWADRTGPKEAGYCPLCTVEPLKTFTLWKILPNKFPYDRIAKVHHMIVPIRHTPEDGLTDAEKAELLEIKKGYINDEYDFILEANAKLKSIPAHFHLHLVVLND